MKKAKKKTKLERFLARFPHRVLTEPRPVYFEVLEDEQRKALIQRGYLPVMLFDMPRGLPHHEVEYLFAKAQAIEEGTAYANKTILDALDAQMKANKMIGAKNVVVRVNVSDKQTDVAALLSGWGTSRHTLRGNTTISEAQLLMEGPAAVKKGKKK
mgnify:CR=1 FL=1